METKFVAEAMLGKLAKWLRIMGYDTHYQPHYREELLRKLVGEGRTLLTRRVQTAAHFSDVLWIQSDRVHEQLQELKNTGKLRADRSKWFTRCLVCNALLEKTPPEGALETVPDHIIRHQNISEIRFCSVCRRAFWPGTHREKMLRHLEEWGF